MTQPFGPATPIQSAAQAPTDGSLMPQRVPLSPSSAPVAATPSTQQLTTDTRVANGVQADAFRDQATILEQMSRYFGDAQDSAAKIAQNLKDAADHVERSARTTSQHAAKTHRAAASATPYHPDAPQPHGEGSGIHGEPTGATRPPMAESPASTGRVTPASAGGMPEGIAGTQYEEGYSQWQGIQQARWNNLADARMSAAKYVNRQFSTWGARRPQVEHDDAGNFIDPTKPEGDPARLLSPEEGATRLRSANRIGQVQGALTKVASGEATFTGALAEVMPYAGVIGGAFAAAHFAQGQVVSQRAQNQFYQQISGGSNWSGFAARGREMGFGYTQMFGMGEGQARQLYRGVSQLGITGDERTSALDFATNEFYKRGMDIRDSMQLISEAVGNGVANFGSLKTALDETSAAAKQGGLNVSEVNKQLAQNYQQVASVTSGAATAPIAAGLTSAMAMQGATMQGVNLTGGLTNDTTMRIMASQSGMGYGQFLGAMQRDPRVFGNAAQSLIESRVQAILPGGLQQSLLAQAHTMLDANGNLSPGGVQTLVQRLKDAGVDPGSIAQTMQQITGQQMDTQQAYEFLARTATGAINVAHQVNASVQAGAVQQNAIPTGRAAQAGAVGTFNRSDDALAKMWNKMGFHSMDMTKGANLLNDNYGRAPDPMRGGSRVDTEAYNAYVKRSGTRIPEIEKLLESPDKDQRFTVTTSDGQRSVTLSEAINHYRDQLAAGTAIINTGNGKGQTVAAYTGVSDPNVSPGQVGMSESSASQKPISAAKAVKGSSASGSVAIYPMPALMDVLRFVPSGGAYIADNRNTAQPNPAFPPGGNVNNLPSSTGPGAGG